MIYGIPPRVVVASRGGRFEGWSLRGVVASVGRWVGGGAACLWQGLFSHFLTTNGTECYLLTFFFLVSGDALAGCGAVTELMTLLTSKESESSCKNTAAFGTGLD